MTYNKGDRIYHFRNNLWENGIEALTVDMESNGVIYCDDYTRNFPNSDYTFCRLGNAKESMVLLEKLYAIRVADDARHQEDVKESVEYQKQNENRVKGVIDVISENLGNGVVSFDKDAMRDFVANTRKQIKWGVLDLGDIKVVPSESEDGVYYPVTKNSCGCPSWYYRHRKTGGLCKHQKEYFYQR